MTKEQLIEALHDKATRLRIHSIRSTAEAGSGHPTSCMSAADIVATLLMGDKAGSTLDQLIHINGRALSGA